MKLTVCDFSFFVILLACPSFAIAGEGSLGGFRFVLPDSWQVEVSKSKTELVGIHAEDPPPQGDLLKMEFCISTDSKPCNASVFYPPAGSNPENYFCGEKKPISTKYANGLDENRKVCSIKNPSGQWQIGMLYLTHGHQNLALGLFTKERESTLVEFLNAFVSSIVLH